MVEGSKAGRKQAIARSHPYRPVILYCLVSRFTKVFQSSPGRAFFAAWSFVISSRFRLLDAVLAAFFCLKVKLNPVILRPDLCCSYLAVMSVCSLI